MKTPQRHAGAGVDLADSPCPHCAQTGHWPAYEAEQIQAGRCPWSGLPLYDVIDIWDQVGRACDVCDCFGYPPHPERTEAPPVPPDRAS